MIAFSGVVSGKRAEKTDLSEDDLALMDEAMVKAIPLLATRTKIGQQPRLYLRVELIDSETVLKDLRSYVSIKVNDTLDDIRDIRSINEYTLEFDKLIDYINDNRYKIKKIYCFHDDDLHITVNGQIKSIDNIFSNYKIIKL